MATDSKKINKCPFCMEEIAPGAIVCKHCGSKITVLKKKKNPPLWRGNFMLGFYCGILAMILLIYLYNKIF